MPENKSIISPVKQDILSQKVDGELVLLDLNTEYYFGLNEIGSRIWELIIQGNEMQSIIDIILGEYDVDSDRLTDDINKLLCELEKAELIRVM